jgi:hypothetical protein
MLRVQLKRIDFENGFIVLPRRVLVKDVYRQNTRNDRTRRIPITPRLMTLLTQRRFIGLVDRLGRWRVWGGLLNGAALLPPISRTRSTRARGSRCY